MARYLSPEYVDKILDLPRGRAARLARRNLLPAIILPDGTIRFPPNIVEILAKTDALSSPDSTSTHSKSTKTAGTSLAPLLAKALANADTKNERRRK